MGSLIAVVLLTRSHTENYQNPDRKIKEAVEALASGGMEHSPGAGARDNSIDGWRYAVLMSAESGERCVAWVDLCRNSSCEGAWGATQLRKTVKPRVLLIS